MATVHRAKGAVVTPPVLILTENDHLLEELLRVCAAAGAEAEVVHGAPLTGERWKSAPLILVGDDWARRALDRAEGAPRVPPPRRPGAAGRPVRGAAGPTPGRRPGVLLVGTDLDDHTVWARGAALGAERVVHLPGDEVAVIATVADTAVRAGPPATTIGVLPGRGGAGASTLACALALAAVRSGRRTVLVDADPPGGGTDLLLATGAGPGDTHRTGPLFPADPRDALPRVRGLHLLRADRGPGSGWATAEAIREVLDATRRRGGVVVVDLPRHLDEVAAEILPRLDLGLLVVPPGVRAARAARRVIEGPGSLVPDLRLVRGPLNPAVGGEPAGPSAAAAARSFGIPLAGELPHGTGPARGGHGEPPGAAHGAPLAAFCDDLLRRISPARTPG
ncbi:hypothetical protein FOE67_24610, partial [Streptomyces calidiresistens]|nr:hypothetical protein [Streptomyces calidiresistens]